LTTKPKLLIDGDVIAYNAACAVQKIYEDQFGYFQPFASRAEGEAVVDNAIYGLLQGFSTSDYVVVLSDPKANWRLDLYPAYKGNRVEDFKGQVRPLLLEALKQYLRDEYLAFHWDELEADDVLGIMSTEPSLERRIICGKDKDFKTIPGLYHRLKDYDAKGNPVVTEVSAWEATRFHMYQTLTGDSVDGYPGCPNIGKTRAEELLQSPVILRATEGVKTVGKNKGQSTTKWVSEPTRDYWGMIVSHYRKGGQGEPEALLNARLANILHHDQYNRETGEITLWTPERLRGL